MKLTLRLIIICLAWSSMSAWAQSANDLEAKYGPPIKVYEIHPGVLLAVRYDENGQASEMRVERHAGKDKRVNLDTTIPPSLSKEIVDELVPAAERGAESNFSGVTLLIGGVGISTDDYENVAITYYTSQSKECSGLVAIIIKWKNRVKS